MLSGNNDARGWTILPASGADSARVFRLRNEPSVVLKSSSGKAIAWDDHARWFAKAANAPDQHRIFLVCCGANDVGVVRLERIETPSCTAGTELWEISAYLLDALVGKGLGTWAIAAACERHADDRDANVSVLAHVRDDNSRGRNAFTKCGFVAAELESVVAAREGHTTLRLDRPRPDVGRVVTHFSSLLAHHGDSVNSVDWGSVESQRRRFELLLSLGIQSGNSVLDVGCGLGGFRAELGRQGVQAQYTGVDVTPGMIEHCQQKYPGDRFLVDSVPFGCNSTLRDEQFDFIVASGIFYLQRSEPDAFMCSVLRSLFASCRIGLAFNCLSTWADRCEPDEYYADPVATLRFAKQLSGFVSLHHEYHPGDFTVLLFQQAHRQR